MNDFFKDVLDKARATADQLLDVAESFVKNLEKESVKSESSSVQLENLQADYERLSLANARLADQVVHLETRAEDLAIALKAVLDTATHKVVFIDYAKFYNLRKQDVNVSFIDNDKGVTIEISKDID